MELPVHVLVDETVKAELGRRSESCKMSLSDYVRNIFDYHIANQTGFTVEVKPT